MPLSIIDFLYHPKAAGFCSLKANVDLLRLFKINKNYYYFIIAFLVFPFLFVEGGLYIFLNFGWLNPKNELVHATFYKSTVPRLRNMP